MYTAGFIGCGSMGGALALAAAKKIGGENILLTNHNIEKANALSEAAGAKIGTNIEIADSCKFIFLGVKPKMMAAVLEEIKPVLQKRTDRFILVSMAAALPAAHISELSGGFPVLRIMPNTPCAVGEGIILYCPNESVSDRETAEFCSMMELAGMVDAVDESLIDAASAVSGCGPAFVYMFIEALSDGGVLCGLPRAKAMAYAAQTVSGSAKALLASGKHPGLLKDEVTSPGGTTIEGVRALEENGFRAAAMNSIVAAYEKTIRMKK